MCGIAGYLGRERFPSRYFYRALADRGPNDRGEWSASVGDGRFLHLLHTRLSILDLSTNASQPMTDKESGGVLVYNGEIFNYRALRQRLGGDATFLGSGDTEVLLRGLTARGLEFLHELDGMFALLWFDAPRRRLVVARDPLGIKPLYYARTIDGGWLFASEARAIAHSGLWRGGVDTGGVIDFLRLGSLSEPCTVFKGIRSFPAGHWGEIKLDAPEEMRTQSFWPVERIMAAPPAQDAAGWHNAVWRETVAEHLQSDVPTGVFLSAGIDSTAILEAVTPQQRGNITAFTLAGEMTPDDESRQAALTASNLQVRHEIVRLGAEEAQRWVRDGLAAMDLPSADGINTYLVSRASRGAGLTVVLSGAGADELHGAYGRAESLSRFSRWAKFSGGASGIFGSAAVAALRTAKGATAAERLALMLAESGEPWRLAQERRRFFTPSQIASLWPDSLQLASKSPLPPTADPDAFAKLCAFDQITLAELRGYLRDMLLRDGDWATMANSQELRVPFLGRRYVECVLRLPAKMRTKRRGVNKPLLAATISAPNRQLLRRRKTGFNISRAELLAGPFKDDFHAATDTLRKRLGICLDASAALRRLRETPSPSEAFRLWALFSLGVYLEQHAGPRSNSPDDV